MILRALRVVRFEVSQVSPDAPRNQDYERDSNHEIEPVKQSLERRILVPTLAQLLTNVSEAETPWQRSGKRIDDKLLQIHPRDARRKRDECANDGKQPAGENDDFAKAREPAIGEIQIMTRNQNVPPVLLDQRTATVHPDPVGDERTDDAAEGASHAD